MQKEKIVKTSMFKSSSTESLRLRLISSKSVLHASGQMSSRSSISEQSKSPLRKFENQTPKPSLQKCFIKPKPRVKVLRSNSSEKCLSISNKEPQIKAYTQTINEYAILANIISKFTVKTIETMKKEYDYPEENEMVYRNFLAIISQIDPVFYKNKNLEFDIKRAKEVFNLYISKPGQVLQTLKTLPKLCENVNVSKSIINQVKKDINSIKKEKLKGLAIETLEILKLIIDIQVKLSNPKSITPLKTSEKSFKIDKNPLTEDNDPNITLMDQQIFPITNEKAPNSSSKTVEADKSDDMPLKTISQNNENKSSKKKLLSELSLKLNTPISIKNLENIIDYTDDFEIFQENILKPNQKIPETNHIIPIESIKTKPPRRSNSNSTLPSYIQILKNPSKLSKETTKPMIKNKKFDLKKQEWEDLRKRKHDCEDKKKKESADEMKKKQEDEESLKKFLMEKKKKEKSEIIKFRNEEICEQRRMKEAKKDQEKMEIMDEVKRNIQKSQMKKSCSRLFDKY
ncbi:hypothetical protein SteCoe_24782 [Stentor coeruleus]|uniref:Uncharacterized protein n=1 Tax=Stentor coeruleus TaxID=5963 RepID=A0A1R2BGS0_9CILI|nr:hypothetical protein SteCoe_24782 [Stentor coeruleus]